ncbi:MAG: class I SAM-dependent methyltransferase [Sphingomonadales bacterium]|nr:class I SAM-dependent methyltransferase [Sphingomonadales bacterium]
MENTDCPICQSSVTKSIYNDTLLQCNHCKHGWANLQLDHAFLQALYAENYFKGEEYADYLADKDILQLNFKKRIKTISKQIPYLNSALEIGCAYGFFYQTLQNRFPNVKYIGYDISADAIAYANQHFGPFFSAANFLDIPSETKQDAIFMWDVIEHLADPAAFIKKAHESCKPAGMLYLTTGDFGAALSRLQGKKWRMIHPPTHLHYFTKKSIQKLLLDNGFEPIFVKYPPVYRSLGLIYFALFILNKKPSRFHQWIYRHIPRGAAIPFNTFDIFFVGAKKMQS